MLDDKNFLKWIAQIIDYKLHSLKNLVNVKSPNQRINTAKVNHQAIYDFCVQNPITSNDSLNSAKKITKMIYLKKFKNISDPDICEQGKCRKKSSSITMILATKKIYAESIWKLHQTINKSHSENNSVSLTTFFNLKPFYCVQPSEKEKKGCLWIYCLNPHVILSSINKYRHSQKLPPHASLTTYLNELKSSICNCTSVFPILNEIFHGKYIELHFLHDSVFVDYIIRDIIERYGIKTEDLWIQSDNVLPQYNNKHAFAFYQKLADDFVLHIIRT